MASPSARAILPMERDEPVARVNPGHLESGAEPCVPTPAGATLGHVRPDAAEVTARGAPCLSPPGRRSPVANAAGSGRPDVKDRGSD